MRLRVYHRGAAAVVGFGAGDGDGDGVVEDFGVVGRCVGGDGSTDRLCRNSSSRLVESLATGSLVRYQTEVYVRLHRHHLHLQRRCCMASFRHL